jgi:predicted dehydrogenase
MSHLSRRHFFYGSLLAGTVPAGGFGSAPSLRMLGYKSPNEKLNIAAIGAGGKGAVDIAGCSTENIVALADPDAKKAAGTFEKYDKAAKYKDFRQMLDKEKGNIDAVIVSTPDFMHGTAAMWAMERGKHVYCQKPLTRTIWEARELAAAAAQYKVATQMGNQGYSNDGTRVCAEIVWSGEIGPVTEVHAWTNRPIWPQGLQDPPKETAVPETFDWDIWLGIAEMRPYSPAYAPFAWRGFFDFGCGALGDMACHILGAPNVALRLGAPSSVECVSQEGTSKFTYPKKSVIRFDFPARGSMPPVKIFWHDGMGGPPPRPAGIPDNEVLGDLPRRAAAGGGAGGGGGQRRAQQATNAQDANARFEADVARRAAAVSNGSLFIGEKGFLTTGTYGENTRLVPAERMKDFVLPPQFLTRSPGHYRDWIRACKGGDPACSNFGIAAPFTEWILLGVLALRFQGKLEWDSARMRVTNVPAANEMIKPRFRKGWSFT